MTQREGFQYARPDVLDTGIVPDAMLWSSTSINVEQDESTGVRWDARKSRPLDYSWPSNNSQIHGANDQGLPLSWTAKYFSHR